MEYPHIHLCPGVWLNRELQTLCHLRFNCPTSTQAARGLVVFLTVMFLFWPIARTGAEQRQSMVMAADMILAIEDRLA